MPAGAVSKYDLVANLVHDGAAGRGTYRAHVQRRSEGAWYEVQDLHVNDILPQARRPLTCLHLVGLWRALWALYRRPVAGVLPGHPPALLRSCMLDCKFCLCMRSRLP